MYETRVWADEVEDGAWRLKGDVAEGDVPGVGGEAGRGEAVTREVIEG